MSSFKDRIFEQCREHPGRIALPEGGDPRVLEAAAHLIRDQLFAEVHLFDAPVGEELAKYLGSLAESSGIFLHKSADGKDALWEAGEGLQAGRWDCVLAGAVRNTSDVIRSALRTIGLSPNCRTVSGGFMLVRARPSASDGEELLFFADAGVVVEPTVPQLVDIALASVATWQALVSGRGGEAPRIAFLSFSTKGSAQHASIEKMNHALELFRQCAPGILADGELQFDAAFVPEVASRKAKNSPLQGQSNIFIFPDLNSGNLGYKIAQRLGGFDAYGPILQGTAKPFCDLSRGASVSDIVVSACIARLRA